MSTPRNRCVSMAALAFMLGTTVAVADDGLPFAYLGPDIPSPTEQTAADGGGALEREARRFLTKAARFGWESAQLSQLAMIHAPRSDVRRFAAELVKSHEAMNEELAELAERKDVRLAERPATDSREWTEKDAQDFEEDYLERMIELHQTAVEWFESTAQQESDNEIAAYAAKHLPMLQEHWRMARELAGAP